MIFTAFVIGNAKDNFPQDIHKKIDTLILAKEFDKAEEIALKAYKKFPNEPVVICALACVYRNKAYKSLVNINLGAMGLKEGQTGTVSIPTDSASFKKAFSEKDTYDVKEYKKAQDLYEKILKIDPTFEHAYYNLLNDYVTIGDFEKYFPLVDRFIDNMSDDELKKNSLIDLASKLANNKNVNRNIAIQMYERILKAYPDYSYAISDLATMYHLQGETKKAIPLFKKAYEKDKGDKITLTNYVYSLVYVEDFQNAYNLAINLSKVDTLSYYLTGMLGYLIGKPYIKFFKKLARYRIEATQDAKKDFWYTNAIEYEKVSKMKLDDKLNFFQYQLDNFNKAQMKAEAIVAGNIVRKIKPTSFALLVLGGIYDSNLNLEMTLKYLDLINKMREADSTIISEYALLSNYARIYLVKEKFIEAQKYLLKTKGMKENDARLNHYFGLCCLGLEKKDEAIAYFRENAKLDIKEEMEWINQSIWKLRELGLKE